MIRDVMNEDAGYYKSLLESLRMDMIFTSNADQKFEILCSLKEIIFCTGRSS